MKVIRKIFAALAVLTVISCVEQVDDTGFTPETPEISFGEESLSVEKNGGELTVMLNSNLPWRIKSCASWVTPSVTYASEGCEIVLTVQKNRLRESRTAVLTAYITDDAKANLSVVQDPAEASESITYHVKTDGDPLSDGGSWETATTLATALYNAGDGDVLLLAAGTYAPAALLTGGTAEQEKTFEIHSNFTMKGGYPADAVTGAVADPTTNETVLSGEISSSISAYHVVTVTAAKSNDSKVVLKNLTISGGKGTDAVETVVRNCNGATVDAAYGGGVFVGVSNAEFVNCRISDNASCHGAGAFLHRDADVLFKGCTITANSAGNNGGGIWNCGAFLEMYDCTIHANLAGQQAAGFYSIDGDYIATSVSRIYNTTISSNDNTQKTTGRTGGGAYIRAMSDAVFVNCTFAGNKSGNGGGLAGHGARADRMSNTVCISCTFKDNLANNNGGAVCVYNNYATVKAYNTIISGNNGPSTSVETGLYGETAASQLSVCNSILGGSLLDETGTTVSGWNFDASAMLGTLGLYGNGMTQCYPLTGGESNPALAGGLDTDALKALVAGFTPAVDAAMLAVDQTGASREGTTSIGSCLAK